MNVATIFPLWPGNVGLLQAAVALPLVPYGVAYSTGFAFGIGLQAIEMSVGVGVGLIFLAREGLSFAMLRGMPDASEARDGGRGRGRAASGGRPVRALACPASLKGVLSAPRPRPRSRRGCARAAPKPTSCRSRTAARGRPRCCGRARRRVARGGGRAMRSGGRGARAGCVLPDGTAVVEAAAAVPLDPLRLDPLAASSRGLGELVAAALDDGRRRCCSLSAGRRRWTRARACARSSHELPVPTRVACDVSATLADAARLFGPQKGAGPEEIAELERRFAAELSRSHGPGAGAAGGLGAALAALGAELVPGAALVLDAIGFEPAGVRPRRHRRGPGRRDDRAGQGAGRGRAAVAEPGRAASSSAAWSTSRCRTWRRSRSRATRRVRGTTSSRSGGGSRSRKRR